MGYYVIRFNDILHNKIEKYMIQVCLWVFAIIGVIHLIIDAIIWITLVKEYKEMK